MALAGLDAPNAGSAEERIRGESQLAKVAMEQRLGLLGTLGSTAPFIGLFGTVIGIVRAFRELANSKGQIWKLALDGSAVTLFLEPRNADLVDMCDNLCVAPWGDLFLCEDGPGYNRIIGVTPKGEVYTFAQNILNLYELAGACFSPDGSTLFVNLQRPGITLAVTGDWTRV